MRLFYLFFALFTFIDSSLGALYTDPSQLPQTTYDYIIVGGTASLGSWIWKIIEIIFSRHGWQCHC
jgi:hypothetical protein